MLEGDHIALASGSSLRATGATGGGTVLVGGDWQGNGPTAQAGTVTMAAGATIDASATHNGDGGTVVLWSDVTNAASQTTAQGRISARGGMLGGDGGRVETSGHALDTTGLHVDAAAPRGNGGLWLIDPYNYTINANAASAIAGTLNGGTDVAESRA